MTKHKKNIRCWDCKFNVRVLALQCEDCDRGNKFEPKLPQTDEWDKMNYYEG